MRPIGAAASARWRRTFATARAALCRDDLATTLPLFEGMAVAFPRDLEVRLHAAWSRARLAGGDVATLEPLAREALARGEALALPLCVLGHVALKREQLHVARTLFRRASKADPALLDAQRGLRIAERRVAHASLLRRARIGCELAALGLAVALAAAGVMLR